MHDATPGGILSRSSTVVLLVVAGLHGAFLAIPLCFSAVFSPDWVNHLWLANYVTHHLASSWILPMFVSVVGGIGYPIFIFYGCGLYSILAPLVELLGPDAGMRVAVVSAFLLPNVVLARLLVRCLEDAWIAGCVTIVLSTSIYQLTNVYARGAMTEFFAYQLLLFGLVVLMDAFLDEEGLDRSLKEIVGLTSGALGMLTHPPTAYLSILFLGAPAGAFVNLLRNIGAFSVRRLRLVLIALVIIALPVATWMALAWSYSSSLALSDLGTGKLNFFPWSVDHWLARLLPWPMDFRVDDEGLDLVSAPYLSAPINGAALLLLIHLTGWAYGNVERQSVLKRFPVTLFMIAIGTATSVSLLASLPVGMLETSTEPHVKPLTTMAYSGELSWRDSALGPIQFAYRLVNITNLSVVFGCLSVILLTTQRQWRYKGTDLFFSERSRAVLIVATTICMLTACIKTVDVYKEYWLLPAHNNRFLLDANGVWQPRGMRAWVSPDNIRKLGREVRHTASLPSTEYGLSAYAAPKLFPAYEESRRPIEKAVSLRQEDASGAVATASCEQPCALMTDLVVSPFFQVSLNGTIVPLSDLRSSGDGFVTILAHEGEHRITVNLGTWATRLYGHATLALAGLFWCSVGIVLIRTVRSVVSSRVNGRLDFTGK